MHFNLQNLLHQIKSIPFQHLPECTLIWKVGGYSYHQYVFAYS